MNKHSSNQVVRFGHIEWSDPWGQLLPPAGCHDLLALPICTFSAKGTDDFFEVIRRRYECRSTIVTTNRDFQGWEAMLGDAVIASAIIDRLVHHGHVIKILGDSYRLNSALEAKTNTQTPQEQSPENITWQSSFSERSYYLQVVHF